MILSRKFGLEITAKVNLSEKTAEGEPENCSD